MLSAGTNIQQAGDLLKPLSVEHLFHSLCQPTPVIQSRIEQLQIVRQTDAKLYARAKRLLPYFVCATFNPAVRRTENFAYTSYFIIDLDHFADKQLDITTTRMWIQTDPCVVLCFLSPSRDGLKVMFRLKERCYDAGMYSLFYREFVRRFSSTYRLEQVADAHTCDVTRACFISADADAYFNPDAESVDMSEYLNPEDTTSLWDMKRQQEKDLKAASSIPDTSSKEVLSEPDADTLDQIKEKLDQKRTSKPAIPRLPIYVPERLESIITGVKQFIEDQGVAVYEILNIQYGKKICCKLGARLAEVNLFYGKRGFSIVQSPKAIVSSDMNRVVAEMIQIYLDDNT